MDASELWVFNGGDPLTLSVVAADGQLTEHLLGERRRTPLDRRWWWWPVLGAATLVTLGTLGLGLTVAVDQLLFHPEPHSRHETTRTRAATIRSAASLYVAWTPGSDCPTVDVTVQGRG